MNLIKRGLLAYLLGEQSFLDFQDWLTAQSWAPANQFTPADLELVREVELRVAEFTGGFLTEDELRDVVREMVGFSPRVVRCLWEMENAPIRQPSSVRRTGSAQARRIAAF